MQLPKWLTKRAPIEGRSLEMDIDAHAAYEALVAEFRKLYETKTPNFMTPEEWEACLKGLKSEKLTAYWLEVVYQAIKMDAVMAAQTHNVNLYVHDAGKKYAQATRPAGRGAWRAAGHDPEGGKLGPVEARKHYMALRGFIPNFG